MGTYFPSMSAAHRSSSSTPMNLSNQPLKGKTRPKKACKTKVAENMCSPLKCPGQSTPVGQAIFLELFSRKEKQVSYEFSVAKYLNHLRIIMWKSLLIDYLNGRNHNNWWKTLERPERLSDKPPGTPHRYLNCIYDSISLAYDGGICLAYGSTPHRYCSKSRI